MDFALFFFFHFNFGISNLILEIDAVLFLVIKKKKKNLYSDILNASVCLLQYTLANLTECNPKGHT